MTHCRERATPWRFFALLQHTMSATEWRAPGK